jgi:cyclase
VIASGGLSNMADIEKLCAVEDEGIEGRDLRAARSIRATSTSVKAQAKADELGPNVRSASAAKRIIPCLDVDGRPGRQGRQLRRIARRRAIPWKSPAALQRAGADELTFPRHHRPPSDGRDLILPIIEAVASRCSFRDRRGGVRTGGGRPRLLNAGATRPSFNSRHRQSDVIYAASDEIRRAMHRCGHRRQAAQRRGSRAAARLGCLQPWRAQEHRPRRGAMGREMAGRGAGEILLTSMDRDGTKAGFDLALTRAVSDAVRVPVIASGGVGNLDHLADGIQQGGADAVLAASIFHYGEYTVGQAKARMAERGIAVGSEPAAECRTIAPWTGSTK